VTPAADSTTTFRALHVPGQPLLLPNPWDVGTAKLLAGLGFQALATTSSGHAATLGRSDGAVTKDEALAHAAAIVGAVNVPVSADLENGFDDSPEAISATVGDAVAVGLAGCSIEDFTGNAEFPVYDLGLAAERVVAAALAARTGPGLVLTARAENFVHGIPDLADTISRLQAYQEAGADVLYAPGLTRLAAIRSVLSSTCSCGQAWPPWVSWRRPEWPASPSVAPSARSRWVPSLGPDASCSRTAPTRFSSSPPTVASS